MRVKVKVAVGKFYNLYEHSKKCWPHQALIFWRGAKEINFLGGMGWGDWIDGPVLCLVSMKQNG